MPFTTSSQNGDSGSALPLDYQASMGTFDFIVVINYIQKRHFDVNAAVQFPVINCNGNTFLPDEYCDKRAESYSPSNRFGRMADVLFCYWYYFNVTKSRIIRPSVLAVYHLGQDTYENRFGRWEVINGSQGLTLNAP